MDRELFVAIVIALISLAILIFARRQAQFGRLRMSHEATEAYRTSKVEPHMNYFISGAEDTPNAVIGLYADWTLESDLWKKRELDPERMKALVEGMQHKALERNLSLHGFNIVDNGGRKIGTWFSVMGIDATVRVKDDRHLVLDSPPQDTYQR